MRGWTRRWIMPSPDGTGVLPATRGTLVDRLLAQRGFDTPEARAIFESPRDGKITEPESLPGASEAALRLVEAIRSGHKIALFGDYDVDGIMATSILYHAIKRVEPTAQVRLYIPDRIKEGYGLNVDALTRLKEEGCDLVVSLDCGVTAFAECEAARKMGLELIITDHHAFARSDENEPRLPDSAIFVHPARPDAPMDFTGICGAGVALKLAIVFFRKWCGVRELPVDLRELLVRDLFAFAALATIADVVPLVDENRLITAVGLRSCALTTNKGLRALLDECGFNKQESPLRASDVAFRVAPVLNAAGRLGSADDALRLMTEADQDEATRLAKALMKLNRERQTLCTETTEKATVQARASGFLEDDKHAIVLAHESFHPGLIGICCSRLAEEYGRPVILLARGETHSRGSARSIPGFSLQNSLRACERDLNGDGESVMSFGGHDAAAGMTIENGAIDAFIARFQKEAQSNIGTIDPLRSVSIDMKAELSDFTPEAMRRLENFEPFGAGNPRPRFVIQDVRVVSVQKIGKTGEHLRSAVSSNGHLIDALWWRAADRLEQLHDAVEHKTPIDIVVEASINRFRGRETVQFELQDVRSCEASKNELLAGVD